MATFSSLGRNAIFDSKFVNANFSISKYTHITEKLAGPTAGGGLQYLR